MKFFKLLPKGLLARFLLIVLLPLILAQLIAVYFFYERHWDSIQKNLIRSIGGDISYIIDFAEHHDFESAKKIASNYFSMEISQEKIDIDNNAEALSEYLSIRLNKDVAANNSNDKININIDDEYKIILDEKRLHNSSTYIFVFWIIGSTVFLSLVALSFLRNQVRSITALADAADKIGRGEDIKDFKPSGAREIRKAGIAFIQMKERLRRLN